MHILGHYVSKVSGFSGGSKYFKNMFRNMKREEVVVWVSRGQENCYFIKSGAFSGRVIPHGASTDFWHMSSRLGQLDICCHCKFFFGPFEPGIVERIPNTSTGFFPPHPFLPLLSRYLSPGLVWIPREPAWRPYFRWDLDNGIPK